MFENVVVQNSNSNTTKEFRDVSIEVIGKEIYIGSNYKVKWKHVASLTCKNDVDDPDDDESGSGSGSDNPSLLQEYRDSDYNRAGFKLICSREAKPKSKSKVLEMSTQGLDAEDTAAEDLRTFWARFPVPPDGHRSVGASWEAFRNILQGGYRRECTKRRKKKDRERARQEEELQQQQQELRRKKSSFSRSRSSRTYSKRPYDFMRKNAANIASNAEVWTDDEEEASGNSPDPETTPELVPVDELPEEIGVMDDGNGDDDGNDDESEHEFQHDFGEETANSDGNENSVGAVAEDNPRETSNQKELGNDDDSKESVVNRLTTKSPSSHSSRRRRIKRRAPVLDDSEDEDDELFQNVTAGLTTPETTVQRVVTPAMAKATGNSDSKQKTRRILEDDDDDDDGGKDREKEQDQTDETDEEIEKTNKKVNSFFKPRSKTDINTKDMNPNSNGTITKDSPLVVAVTTADSLGNLHPRLGDNMDMNGDDGSDEGAGESVLTNASHKAKERTPAAVKSLKSFFDPRSKSSHTRHKTKTPTRLRSPKKKRTLTTTKSILDNSYSDSDETSTVVPGSHTPDVNDETMDNGDNADVLTPARSSALRAHSPKKSRVNFKIARVSGSKIPDGRNSIEEEDPIEEADSSQSQSPSTRPSSSFLKRSGSRLAGGRLSSSIKRRRLKINGSRSALEALEFADTKKHQFRSPVPMPRPIEDATSTETATSGERSPIQPLKLGPQVEMAATDRSNKWRGLRNDGNSCYVNSSLQQLFSVPKFMQSISSRRNGHELAATLSDLYADLLGKSAGESSIRRNNAGSARGVKKVMDRLTDRFHGCQQRDAHEFLGEVIDQIHEELSPPSTGNEQEGSESKQDGTGDKSESPRKEEDSGAREIEPTDEFFRWNVQVCLKCKSCGYSRSKEEMYRYLSIDIGHDNADPRDPGFVKPAVDSCLANFFAPEDREVNCEKCKVGKIATQTMKILSMPKVILLHLKRFIAVERPIAGTKETELVFKKNKVPVDLTTNLAVGKLLTSNQSSGTACPLPQDKYRLKSIVHHIGNTANSGHYTTDALRADPEDGKDQWVSFDDGVAVERSLERVTQTTSNQKTAYTLLYSID